MIINIGSLKLSKFGLWKDMSDFGHCIWILILNYHTKNKFDNILPPKFFFRQKIPPIKTGRMLRCIGTISLFTFLLCTYMPNYRTQPKTNSVEITEIYSRILLIKATFFTKEVTKELVSRNILSLRVNFMFFHTVTHPPKDILIPTLVGNAYA